MSNCVDLHYTIKYTACELAQEEVECKPVLRIYYDTHFERSEADGGIITLHLDEHNLEKTYSGILHAKSNPRLENKIPETARIGFASYAERKNDAGMSCYTNAGTTDIKVKDILDCIKAGQPYVEERPLLMENLRINGGEAYEKGRIQVTVSKFSLGRDIAIINQSQCILSAPTDELSAVLTDFISARMDDEAQIPDTWPGTANVRAPMDISNAGIQLTKKCFLPVEGYTMQEPLVVNVDYFDNAARRQLIRRGLTMENDYASLDLARKAELMADMCVYASQSFDYISDTVDKSNRMRDKTYDPRLKEGMEDFGVAGVTFSADCEDTGEFNQVVNKAYVALDINQSTHPELYEMQKIAKNYNCFITIATVHGAKAEDETERIGAHCYTLWFPKKYIKQMLETNDAGRVIASRLPLDSEYDNLPVLFGEGTGRIRSLGTGPDTYFKTMAAAGLVGSDHPSCFDPLINARRYIGANLRGKSGIKCEIPHDRGASSNFYLGNLLVVTPDYIDLGFNLGYFTVCQIQPNGQLTRGATFVDIINQHSNVALVPAQPIPTPIMSIMREATALRAPPRPFILDKTKPMEGLEVHPLFERVKANVASLNRKGSSPFGSVDLFYRPHQFNAASLNALSNELCRLKHVYKVDYQLEHITNAVCVYRFMIFVDDAAL